MCIRDRYNTPLQNRSKARHECQDIVDSISDEDEGERDNEEDEDGTMGESLGAGLAQSKPFKLQQRRQQMNKEQLQELKNNTRYFHKLDKFLTEWFAMRKNLAGDDVDAIMVLFLAHLNVQLELPEGDKVKDILETKFADEWEWLQPHLGAMKRLPNVVRVRPAVFREQGNMVMSLYNVL